MAAPRMRGAWIRGAGTIAVLAAALVACDVAATLDGVAVSASGSVAPTLIASATLDRAEPPEPRPRVAPGDYFVDLETGEATSLPGRITRLTRNGGGGYRVSPDGTQVLFEVVDRGSPFSQLFLANLDGMDVRQLTDEPRGAGSGDFSPDGTRIAYVIGWSTYSIDSNIPRNQKILVLGPGYRVSARVAPVGTPSAMPRFGPEGNEILFTDTRRARVGLWTVPTSGGEEPVELRRHAMWGTYSPDGEGWCSSIRCPQASIAAIRGGSRTTSCSRTPTGAMHGRSSVTSCSTSVTPSGLPTGPVSRSARTRGCTSSRRAPARSRRSLQGTPRTGSTTGRSSWNGTEGRSDERSPDEARIQRPDTLRGDATDRGVVTASGGEPEGDP